MLYAPASGDTPLSVLELDSQDLEVRLKFCSGVTVVLQWGYNGVIKVVTVVLQWSQCGHSDGAVVTLLSVCWSLIARI
jgi:hypothetical protein